MLLYPAMKDLLKNIPSRYRLVNVVAHRAREIANEADAGPGSRKEKAVTLAIQEAADGLLTLEDAPV